MKTTRELIDFLRGIANILEDRLENGEIGDKLDIHTNTYRLSCNFISTCDGFIDLEDPSEEERPHW